jgi:hypothetical protein
MALINHIQTPDDVLHNLAIPFGSCTTAAGTAAKIVDVGEFTLTTGAMVAVKFTNTNSASAPTLNVSSTGAKSIKRYGTTAAGTSGASSWQAGAIMIFVYDGTNWLKTTDDTNNTYTNAALGQIYGTCSTAAATVAKTVSYSNYALATGGIVSIRFANAVPANSTLNINGKGAKAIYYQNAPIIAGIIGAGMTATFIYDGSYYHLISTDAPIQIITWGEDD